jgi:repressor LexA
MDGLTNRQTDVLRFIRSYIRREGFGPSVRDICVAIGIKSPNAALRHMRAIERAGYIRRSSGIARGIILVDHSKPSQN